MTINAAPGPMTSDDIVEPSRRRTFFSGSAQDAIDPIAIDIADGAVS